MFSVFNGPSPQLYDVLHAKNGGKIWGNRLLWPDWGTTGSCRVNNKMHITRFLEHFLSFFEVLRTDNHYSLSSVFLVGFRPVLHRSARSAAGTTCDARRLVRPTGDRDLATGRGVAAPDVHVLQEQEAEGYKLCHEVNKGDSRPRYLQGKGCKDWVG